MKRQLGVAFFESEKTFGNINIDKNVYEWIIDNIKPGSTILELGSGYVSSLLVKHYNLYSIEESKRYVNEIEGVNYIYAPLKNEWYNIDYKQLPEKYDLLLVDGPLDKFKRLRFVRYFKKFYTNCPIIIDDTNRDIDKLVANTISKILKRPIFTLSTPEGFPYKKQCSIITLE